MSEEKLSMFELEQNVLMLVTAGPQSGGPTPFPKDYRVLIKDGGRLPVEVNDDGLVTYVDITKVTHEIMRFTYQVLDHQYRKIKLGAAKTLAETWLATTWREIDYVAPIKFPGEDTLAFAVTPYDPEEREIPLWEEFISRCDNGKAFEAWVGSLFVPDSDKSQYVWLYGSGRNGKSSVTELIDLMLGDASTVITNYQVDKFFASNFLGKRLALFPDCDRPDLPAKGVFKSLTGNDPIQIEFKGKDAFKAKLDCKFLFLSNDELRISGSTADLRRAIYVCVKPITGAPQAGYIPRLRKEIPGILFRCISRYRDLCPSKYEIPLEVDIDDQLSVYDEAFETFFEDTLEVDPEGAVWASDIAGRLKIVFGHDKKIGEFKKYLQNRHGVQIGRKVKQGKKCTYWSGVKKKERSFNLGAEPF